MRSKMDIEIRPYEDRDLEDLMEAWEKASRAAHSFMDEAFFDKERHNIPNIYLPNAETWVVAVDRKVCGFIAMIGNTIGGLFVGPSFHGKGLGYSLVKEIEKIHGDLLVDVFEDNTLGRQFYSRYGFKLIKRGIWEETGDKLMHMAYNKPS